MNEKTVETRGGVFSRALLLYGLYTLLNSAFFLIGYYLLPEGLMRGGPQSATGMVASSPRTFWPEFALTLLFNIGFTSTLAVVLNFNRMKGVPAGYIVPSYLGIVNGLVLGTNSFLESDLSEHDAREGLALGLTIGGLEALGFILIVASTVAFGVFRYRSWWRWGGEDVGGRGQPWTGGDREDEAGERLHEGGARGQGPGPRPPAPTGRDLRRVMNPRHVWPLPAEESCKQTRRGVKPCHGFGRPLVIAAACKEVANLLASSQQLSNKKLKCRSAEDFSTLLATPSSTRRSSARKFWRDVVLDEA